MSLNADKHFAIIDYSSASCAAEALKTVAVKHDGSVMKVEARRRGAAKPKGDEKRAEPKGAAALSKGGGDWDSWGGKGDSDYAYYGKGGSDHGEGGWDEQGGGRKSSWDEQHAQQGGGSEGGQRQSGGAAAAAPPLHAPGALRVAAVAFVPGSSVDSRADGGSTGSSPSIHGNKRHIEEMQTEQVASVAGTVALDHGGLGAPRGIMEQDLTSSLRVIQALDVRIAETERQKQVAVADEEYHIAGELKSKLTMLTEERNEGERRMEQMRAAATAILRQERQERQMTQLDQEKRAAVLI